MSQSVTPLLERRLDHQIDRATDAAAEMLRALGLPIDDEDMAETPRRLVQAYAELLSPEPFEMTTFPNSEEYDEMVLVRDIPVRSLCEHHMLPFVGVAHVGYLPADRIVGLSKLARTVDHFARRVQTQERLTSQVADHLRQQLAPHGVGVVIEAEHTCMSVRGARAEGASTVTARLLGRLREDPATRAEFLALTREQGGRS
jgi:GTP cyclohydrolase I